MDVRLIVLRITAAAGPCDQVALGHDCPSRDDELGEMLKRHREPAGSPNRQRLATVRNSAREAHRPGGGRDDGLAEAGGDVNAPVLAGCIRIALQRKGAKDFALRGPGPRRRGRGQ
jgi:hypothetical protein